MSNTHERGQRRGPRPLPAAVRVRRRTVVQDMGYETPCFIWTGSRSAKGYGKVGSRVDGRNVYELVHRVTWQAENGPVPDGLHLDHLCAVPACCRPSHLEPVTAFENNRRQALRRSGLAKNDPLITRPPWDVTRSTRVDP